MLHAILTIDALATKPCWSPEVVWYCTIIVVPRS
jgi:hypothetical protein